MPRGPEYDPCLQYKPLPLGLMPEDNLCTRIMCKNSKNGILDALFFFFFLSKPLYFIGSKLLCKSVPTWDDRLLVISPPLLLFGCFLAPLY